MHDAVARGASLFFAVGKLSQQFVEGRRCHVAAQFSTYDAWVQPGRPGTELGQQQGTSNGRVAQ
jgi:hypothetical protein